MANVSPATVSNVLNGRPVSVELRERVYNAISQLEYIPNQAARSLMTRSSRQIGFVMESLRSAQMLDVVQGAQFEAVRQGYLLSIALYTQDTLQSILHDYIMRDIEGIICEANAHIDLDDWHHLSAHVPLVRIGNPTEPGDVNLMADYYNGMCQAYQALYDMGHRDIIHVSGLSSEMQNDRYVDKRLAGFVDCMEAYGNINEQRFITGSPPFMPNQNDGYRMTRAMIARKIPFTAIIVTADLMALGVVQALRDAGLSVPGDVSVVSFNNTLFATTCYPALSSMSVPSFQMGCDAVREMLKLRGNELLLPEESTTTQSLRARSMEDGHITLRYPMEFIARQSTAPLLLHEGYEASLRHD